MEFEQKAEEKKMSMSKNIARLAVTAGLTAALSFGGVMAPVTMAFADDPVTAPANGIIIEQSENNKGTAKTRFVPYQIFKAKVHDGENRRGARLFLVGIVFIRTDGVIICQEEIVASALRRKRITSIERRT